MCNCKKNPKQAPVKPGSEPAQAPEPGKDNK